MTSRIKRRAKKSVSDMLAKDYGGSLCALLDAVGKDAKSLLTSLDRYSDEQVRQALGTSKAEYGRSLASALAKTSTYNRLLQPVDAELTAAWDELESLTPQNTVRAVHKINSARQSRAARHNRNRPSPYANEYAEWRKVAAMERALNPCAKPVALAEKIRAATNTRASNRIRRAWVRANSDDIDVLARKYREKARLRP